MNFLVSKLSGLRVLCGETINNCLPIHKMFAQATEQDLEGENGNGEKDDPFAQTSNERQNNKQNKQDYEEEEEERKHFKDEASTNYSSKQEYSEQSSDFGNQNEENHFATMNQMHQPMQSAFDNFVPTKPKNQKKPMLGNIDEDKIQKQEKNDPVDQVDYFSQMNMGMPSMGNKPAPKAAKKPAQTKAETKNVDLFEEPSQPKFNMNNDAADDVDAAAWGNDVDDIDL